MHRPPPLFTSDISLFLDTLRVADFFILYQALSDEIDISQIPFLEEFMANDSQIFVPDSPGVDPKAYAQWIMKEYGSKHGVIFLPGQKFDVMGTRHGRGGGWYDRFLSQLPHAWIRVGVMNRVQLVEGVLVRQPWDEPMDWLFCVQDGLLTYKKIDARSSS